MEKSTDIGGLWRYTDDEYGVMEFTHINVSKYNYCFSDHPFPESTTDYPHHSEMFKYIQSYSDKFKLRENIKFKTLITKVEGINFKKYGSELAIFFQEISELSNKPKFENIKNYEKLWKITAINLENNDEIFYITPFLSIATGHHSTPIKAKFKGQENFHGKIKTKSLKYIFYKLKKVK